MTSRVNPPPKKEMSDAVIKNGDAIMALAERYQAALTVSGAPFQLEAQQTRGDETFEVTLNLTDAQNKLLAQTDASGPVNGSAADMLLRFNDQFAHRYASLAYPGARNISVPGFFENCLREVLNRVAGPEAMQRINAETGPATPVALVEGRPILPATFLPPRRAPQG